MLLSSRPMQTTGSTKKPGPASRRAPPGFRASGGQGHPAYCRLVQAAEVEPAVVLTDTDDLAVSPGGAVQRVGDQSVGAYARDESVAFRGGLQPVGQPRRGAPWSRVRHEPVDQGQPR